MLTKRRIFEFDDFRVDTGQFVITRSGHAEPITPTVFRILEILLERAGEVVTKEDLMKHVWPDSFVEDGNLNRNISTLRKALDEKPCDHRYIETIPKTGYRFISPVRSTEYQPPAGSARRTAARPVPSLIGREFELGMLRAAFDQAEQGSGSTVTITGDLGLGKTALIDVFIEDLLKEGVTFHLCRARCSESFTESEPFMPWIEALATISDESAVKGVMAKAAPSWHREISHTGSAAPRTMKRELLDFCKQIPVHPMIIVIDDFHLADVSSVDLLAYIAPRLESTRVLVILGYRPVEMNLNNRPFAQVRSDLLSREACIELNLGPLNRKHVEQYLAAHQPNSKFSPDYTALLHAKSDGNPLFIQELVNKKVVSDSVRHMIQRRIDRLDDTHQQLLVTASVQGREFDSAVLAATMQMNTQDVEEALQELDERYGIIRRIREEELPDGKFTVRYRFAYALYQEACYATLAPTRKASLSASLAEAFLTYYAH